MKNFSEVQIYIFVLILIKRYSNDYINFLYISFCLKNLAVIFYCLSSHYILFIYYSKFYISPYINKSILQSFFSYIEHNLHIYIVTF